MNDQVVDCKGRVPLHMRICIVVIIRPCTWIKPWTPMLVACVIHKAKHISYWWIVVSPRSRPTLSGLLFSSGDNSSWGTVWGSSSTNEWFWIWGILRRACRSGYICQHFVQENLICRKIAGRSSDQLKYLASLYKFILVCGRLFISCQD